MAWVQARLRGKKVFARADDNGRLLEENGRVEIRYRANDGRMYLAAAGNLQLIDRTVLPDDTCGPAERPEDRPKATAKSPKRSGSGSSGGPPPAPPEGTIIAYTDGACSSNPGPAGLGVVILKDRERVELSEFLGEGTNNIAELMAILRALQLLDPKQPSMIHTDSRYSIGVIQEGWKAKANQALVEQLRQEYRRHPNTRLVHVKGHAGIPLNERADELARQAVIQRNTHSETLPHNDDGL